MNLIENAQKISQLLHDAKLIETSDSIFAISNASLVSYYIYTVTLYSGDIYIVNTNPGVEAVFTKDFKII